MCGSSYYFKKNCPQGNFAGRGTDRERESLPARNPITSIISIQPNVLLLDGKAQEAPVNAVVDYGSPTCILINEWFNCIGLLDTLRRVRSKVVGGEGSHLEIRGTLQVDASFDRIKAKERFFIFGNL